MATAVAPTTYSLRPSRRRHGVITFPGRRLSGDELDALRTAVMSVVTPMTAEQINALPAAKGWWGFAVAKRVIQIIRDVEAFYGVRR